MQCGEEELISEMKTVARNYSKTFPVEVFYSENKRKKKEPFVPDPEKTWKVQGPNMGS